MSQEIVCLLHGCLRTHCGCPVEVASANFHEDTREVQNLPPLVTMFMDEDPPPGPYRITWRHRRVSTRHTTHSVVRVVAGNGEELPTT